MCDPSAGASSAAGENLERLLAEASHAHEALDRLMSSRPELPKPLPPAKSNKGRLVHATADAICTGSQLPPELFGSSVNPLMAGEPEERSWFTRPQLARRHDPVVERSSTSNAVSLLRTLPSSHQSSAPERTFRVMARLRAELKEAQTTIRELQMENDALRGALEQQRLSLRAESTMRVQLEEARRAAVEMECTRATEQRAMADLKFFLQQSEGERERLRTLLQGTVHSSAS